MPTVKEAFQKSPKESEGRAVVNEVAAAKAAIQVSGQRDICHSAESHG